MNPEITLHNGDCLEYMSTMPVGSVDAIITDLPYGTTHNKWDVVIPFEPMWELISRVLKPRGVFVTTASQPFTSMLIVSNLAWFRYCLVWEKSIASGFLDVSRKPLKSHEDIAIFSHERSTYNPQMERGKAYKKKDFPNRSSHYGNINPREYVNTGTRHPRTVIKISNGNQNSVHPTQKPIALYEYLVETYTNPGETVMDFTAGSGTTGCAAIRLGRKFIGVEKDAGYFEIMKKRLAETKLQPALFQVASENSPV